MSQGNAPNMSTVFGTAAQAGLITQQSLDILSDEDLGVRIQDALGINADDLEASEVLLVVLEFDDSTSIRMAGNSQAIRDSHNIVVKALRGSKSEGAILIHTTLFNRGQVYAFVPIEQAPDLDSSNYQADGNTPFCDQVIVGLGTALAKERELAAQGIPCRVLFVVATDGVDCGSRNTPREVRSLVRDCVARENYIVAGVGISDGSTDFKAVFKSMGIGEDNDDWILTPKNTESEIRKAFVTVSKSAVQASQARVLSKLAGFGA